MSNPIIDENLQKKINQPLTTGALKKEESEFLNIVMKKIDDKEIRLLEPNSILNLNIYEKLNSENEGKVDLIKNHILLILRQIRSMWNLNHQETLQMQNLIAEVKYKKEECEKKYGDVFKI